MTVKMTLDIDEELRTNINILAKKKKTTVRQIVTDLINEYIDENSELL